MGNTRTYAEVVAKVGPAEFTGASKGKGDKGGGRGTFRLTAEEDLKLVELQWIEDFLELEVRNSKRWNNGYVQNETRIGQLDCDVQERKEDKGVWQISNHVSCKRNPNGATGLDKDDQQLLGKVESHDKLNKAKNKWVLYSKRNSPLHNLNYKLLFGKTKEVGTFKDQSSSSYSEEDREPFINSVKTTGGCSMQQKNLIEKNGAISGVKPVSVTVKVSNKAGQGINDDNGLNDGMGNHERSGPCNGSANCLEPVVVDAKGNIVVWNLEGKITSVIEVGAALGLEFGEGEDAVRSVLRTRELEDDMCFR
ncbi:hypothetical protein Q3G72_012229 [Acer saccharum]|nr:hypothetical protein Q3G72_012229 [Acer saccharum]